MLDEMASLSEHSVFELCWLPLGHKHLAGEKGLKTKRGAKGETERFKAGYEFKG